MDAKMPGDIGTKLYFLTIRGTLRPPTIAASCAAHNEVAGSEANVAAARALGDLSHAVFVRADEPPRSGAGEVLFCDVWNSISGLQQFFAHPNASEGGARVFLERDPVVWVAAEQMPSYQLPPPRGHDDRVIGLVRGRVGSVAAAGRVISAAMVKTMNAARKLGHLSRAYYLRLDGDGTEILGVDAWTNLDGCYQFYSRLEDPSVFQMFTEKPATSVWKRPEGNWVEW